VPGTKVYPKVYLRGERLAVDYMLCAIIQNNPKDKATNLFLFNNIEEGE